MRGRPSKRRNAKARRKKRQHSKRYNRAWVAAEALATREGRDWATLSGTERRFWRDAALTKV